MELFRYRRHYEKIAITGANGYLASLIQASNEHKVEFVPVTRRDVDFSQPEAVTRFFENLEFDAVFHTAALSNGRL